LLTSRHFEIHWRAGLTTAHLSIKFRWITILFLGDSIANYIGKFDMEQRGPSLAEIQEVPSKSLILLSGPPGSGKSTFCYQVVINTLAIEKPVIFVATEQSPVEIAALLKEKGMKQIPADTISFIDAFSQTVGLATTEQADTISANCQDLNSINMAIARLQQKSGKGDILLAFDSLTSPYLFNKEEIFRFVRLGLLKFAAEGNSVLALLDEGCGKEEDLGAIMSAADGIMRMEIEDNSRIVNVIKHPKIEPSIIEVYTSEIWRKTIWDRQTFGREVIENTSAFMLGRAAPSIKREYDDYVSVFWSNFIFWSGMLWDPKRFASIMYEINKKHGMSVGQVVSLMPWYAKIFVKLFMPRSFSKVKDMKKFLKIGSKYIERQRSGIVEYLEDISKTNEHYFRIYEGSECSGFENIGTVMASVLPPAVAGICTGLERNGMEWNIIETKCIGLGDPYCELKMVRGEIGELKSSLEKDASVLEKIHERLMERIMGFLLDDKPLLDRPRLGRDIHIEMMGPVMAVPVLGGERFQMAWRMGGARSGKTIGQRLIEAGLSGDEAVKRILRLLEHCKVGKVTMDETIIIQENCESYWTKYRTIKWEEPRCLFTTGFLNGLFSTIKNQHVREIKCIAAGDPYCEWEIK
jgi:predicted hydrocarbon binding protein/KaiC/GvpD/RAD55 family RecA-like ATPase